MFIRVTSANDKKVNVNVDHIESMGVITKENYGEEIDESVLGLTYIFCNGMTTADETYIVKESIDQIENTLIRCGVLVAEVN